MGRRAGCKTQPVSIRFPVEMRDALQKTATESERTLSQEVIFRLRKSLGAEASKAGR